jgi:hypothetical protein
MQNYFQVVEDSIRMLGVDPAACRGQKEGQWSLVKGSANVWIDCWYIEREKRAYYQVMSPIMQVPPARQAELFKELLEINDKLFAVAFTVYDNWVWLKVIREADGMDANEAFGLMTRIGNYADDYDDILKEKYGVAPVGPGGPGAPVAPN